MAAAPKGAVAETDACAGEDAARVHDVAVLDEELVVHGDRCGHGREVALTTAHGVPNYRPDREENGAEENGAEDRRKPVRGKHAEQQAHEKSHPHAAERASKDDSAPGLAPGHALDEAQVGSHNEGVLYRKTGVGEDIDHALNVGILPIRPKRLRKFE